MRVVQKKIKSGDCYTLLDLDSLSVGNVMVFDVFIKKSNDYIIIIEAGTLLSQSLYTKLQNQEKLFVFKEDKNKLSLTCESLKFYVKHNQDNLEKRIKLIYEINSQLFNNFLENKDNKFDINCVNSIVKSIFYLVKYDEKFLKNTMPHFIQEHNLPNHFLHVAIYAMSLGNSLKLNSKELLQLGNAALLHDVGLKRIDDSLIHKSNLLDNMELKEVHKHSQYSVEIIKHNDIHDPYILDAVMHHHEQYDGNGYPEQLEEEDISTFASILAISDVFDALTTNRSYREQYSSFDAIKMMLKDASMVNKFNRKYIQILLKSL